MSKNSQKQTLVLFDFDGTLTTQDTYTRFILFSTGRLRLVLGGLLLSPALLLYKCSVLSASKLRPLISRLAFAGLSEQRLKRKVETFVSDYLPGVIRPTLLQKLREYKQTGNSVVVVSATVSVYLQQWCELQGIDLVCSELEVRHGRYTGHYLGGDCSGVRKVSKLKQRFDLCAFQQVIAYGDTKEDFPMLQMADFAYYQGKPFKAKP